MFKVTSAIVWAACAPVLLPATALLSQPVVAQPVVAGLAYSDMLQEATSGRVRDVVIQGRMLRGTMTDGRTFSTYLPDDPTLASRLATQGIRVTALPEEQADAGLHFLLAWVPSLLFLAVLGFYLNRGQRAQRAIAARLGEINATLVEANGAAPHPLAPRDAGRGPPPPSPPTPSRPT